LLHRFGIAVARVSPAGSALTGEDEVDPTELDRGVKVGARGVVVNTAHDAPPVSVWLAGWSDGEKAVGPIDRARTRAETLDEVAHPGGVWPEFEKRLADA
jgi:hypothetical protein